MRCLKSRETSGKASSRSVEDFTSELFLQGAQAEYVSFDVPSNTLKTTISLALTQDGSVAATTQ